MDFKGISLQSDVLIGRVGRELVLVLVDSILGDSFDFSHFWFCRDNKRVGFSVTAYSIPGLRTLYAF